MTFKENIAFNKLTPVQFGRSLMRTVILLITILYCQIAICQVDLKLIQNTDFFSRRYVSSFENSRSQNFINFSRFSLMINLRFKTTYSHELELFIPEISKSIYDIRLPFNLEFKEYDQLSSGISTYSFRYSFNFPIKTFKNSSIYVGSGFNPYFVNERYSSTSSSVFSSTRKTVGISLNITPGFEYRLFRRFFLNLSIPLNIFHLDRQYEFIENPSLPLRNRKFISSRYKFLMNTYTFRIGLAYRMDKKFIYQLD
jgi:hypothetical protein